MQPRAYDHLRSKLQRLRLASEAGTKRGNFHKYYDRTDSDDLHHHHHHHPLNPYGDQSLAEALNATTTTTIIADNTELLLDDSASLRSSNRHINYNEMNEDDLIVEIIKFKRVEEIPALAECEESLSGNSIVSDMILNSEI